MYLRAEEWGSSTTSTHEFGDRTVFLIALQGEDGGLSRIGDFGIVDRANSDDDHLAHLLAEMTEGVTPPGEARSPAFPKEQNG